MADIIYIDVDEGTKRVMNNSKLYAKLLSKFKDDQSINQINTALAGGDMAIAKDYTHTLKGLAANLSLTELYKHCMELEDQIKAGAAVTDKYSIVKEVYNQTIKEADKVIEQYA
ncbi:MAG: Hpt domain-containing protein [Treponema sp.]|nr:Hpt domain-containing protein [Treponema sp.]